MIAIYQGENPLNCSVIFIFLISRLKCYETDIDLEAFTEPENRLAIVASSKLMKMYHLNTYKTGMSSIVVSDEDVAPLTWGFSMNAPMKDIISLKASQLNEAGILSHDLNNLFFKYPHSKPEDIGPQVLTLKHLRAGFVVILCLLALSIAVFAVEIVPKLWRKLVAWLEKAIFCCIVLKFTIMNKLM
jgi:hypothetical protein